MRRHPDFRVLNRWCLSHDCHETNRPVQWQATEAAREAILIDLRLINESRADLTALSDYLTTVTEARYYLVG